MAGVFYSIIQYIYGMKIEHTQRGVAIIEFLDWQGRFCSMQKSNLPTKPAIWLGTNEDRMHLTQAQVKELMPFLQKFIETGEID